MLNHSKKLLNKFRQTKKSKRIGNNYRIKIWILNKMKQKQLKEKNRIKFKLLTTIKFMFKNNKMISQIRKRKKISFMNKSEKKKQNKAPTLTKSATKNSH